MNCEGKLVQGLKLVVEAFAEMINENRKVVPASTEIISSEPAERTFKRKQAAEYLQITENALYTATRQGKVKHLKSGNRYLYRKSALDEWIKEELQKSIKIEETEQSQYGKLRKVKV